MKDYMLVICLLLMSSPTQASSFYFVGTNFPAIVEQQKNGEITGLGVDIAQEIFKRLGHQLIIEVMPLKRALKMVEQGVADGMIGPYKSPERELYMNYTDVAFYQDQIMFYVLQNSTLQWQGHYSKLNKLVVGVIRGWNYGEQFEKNEANLNISAVNTVEASFLQLLYNRVDVIVCHPRAAAPVIEKLALEYKVRRVLPILTVNKGYFGFTKKESLTEVFEQFDSELTKMLVNGEIQYLSESYGLNYHY